jgi:hypothetical protein
MAFPLSFFKCDAVITSCFSSRFSQLFLFRNNFSSNSEEKKQLTPLFSLQDVRGKKRRKEDHEAYERIKEGIADSEEDHLDLDLRSAYHVVKGGNNPLRGGPS